MTKIVYPASSAYADTAQTSWYIGPIKWRNITYDTSDIYISSLDPRYDTKPELLSYDLYNTATYWWVFMARNLDVIRDPIWDLKAGISIFVPTLTRLQTLLGG